MCGLTFYRLAASLVLAGALALPSGGLVAADEVAGQTVATAQDQPAAAPQPTIATADSIDAKVPLPEPADLPPPTAADVGGPATATVTETREPAAAPAAAAPVVATVPSIDSRVPMPEPADLPPPGIKDIGAPAATSPTLATTGSPVSDKLRDLITARLDRFIDRKVDRKPVETFYAGRSFAPIWVDNGAANPRAKAVIARLQQAGTDGLDPADYRTPDFAGTSPDALAEAELRLTAAAITYARHAQTGRIAYSRISGDIYYDLVFPEPADVLAKLADAKDAADALDAYNPPHEGYKALRAKLAEVRTRNGDAAGPARIATGTLLKVGMQDERVPQVRERLGLASAPGTTYDKALAEAVKKFQREHELTATGNLNGATIERLNGPRRDRDADIIIANMERWRWVPRDLGKTYVMVNIPDFSLRVVQNGGTVWQTRIVTGKPNLPTPLISAEMKYITVNPTWNVPPSIVYNEYLPALQQDPTALERIGLRVSYERDGTVHISQPPGDRNALGRIRFNFPNKFLVYQHDTPDKHLFDRFPRAYSHGCMRVQDPLKYAEVLLSLVLPNEGYTQDRLRRMFGSEERDIKFPAFIPVHLTYQTAFVDETGKLQIRDDVYGRDARILATLRGDERRVADVPVERRPTGSNVPRDALRLGPRPNYTGMSFFERLFR